MTCLHVNLLLSFDDFLVGSSLLDFPLVAECKCDSSGVLEETLDMKKLDKSTRYFKKAENRPMLNSSNLCVYSIDFSPCNRISKRREKQLLIRLLYEKTLNNNLNWTVIICYFECFFAKSNIIALKSRISFVCISRRTFFGNIASINKWNRLSEWSISYRRVYNNNYWLHKRFYFLYFMRQKEENGWNVT